MILFYEVIILFYTIKDFNLKKYKIIFKIKYLNFMNFYAFIIKKKNIKF